MPVMTPPLKLSDRWCPVKLRSGEHPVSVFEFRASIVSISWPSVHSVVWLSMPGTTRLSRVFLRIEGGMSDSVFWVAARPGVVAPVLPWQVASPVDHLQARVSHLE